MTSLIMNPEALCHVLEVMEIPEDTTMFLKTKGSHQSEEWWLLQMPLSRPCLMKQVHPYQE